MDYEKRYKEALAQAKKELAQSGPDSESARQIKRFFPELTESEDERIRKFLLDYAVEMIAGLESDISLSTYDGIKGHDPDAEEELNQWQKARAYLEKQKENPKSADSIPSDCVSDVKCEDRSSKHTDSFGTDIRDTPAYWRGWDDAMKQKEQEHPNGCFTCDEYKKGYEAGRLNGFTAGYNKAMKEQKPAEWSKEDELMILTIIQTLETLGGRGTTGMQIDWLKSLRPSWRPSEEQIQTLIKIHGNSDMPTQQILGSLITELNNLKKHM